MKNNAISAALIAAVAANPSMRDAAVFKLAPDLQRSENNRG
ncbi:MAG TPA: hypothetical protein VN699_15330 [Pirellulales bacterium]|nr:hypothetical protein [Pirellulales bacterium]